MDDTSGALGLVAQRSEMDPADPLLVPSALAPKADRPTGVTILRTTSQGVVTGGQFQAVEVSYQAGGTAVTQSIEVEKNPAAAPAYLLYRPFIVLDVDSAEGRRLSVNGVSVPSDGLSGS